MAKYAEAKTYWQEESAYLMFSEFTCGLWGEKRWKSSSEGDEGVLRVASQENIQHPWSSAKQWISRSIRSRCLMATADIHYTVFWEAEKINSACNTWSTTTDINVKLPNIQSYDPVEQFRTILDNEVFFFLAYFLERWQSWLTRLSKQVLAEQLTQNLI